LTITTPTVLANDSDMDGDGLTAVNATKPVNGEITLNLDGTFTYTPDTGFDGVDTFTYQAQDDGVGSLLSNVATVYITVTGTNDAPTAVDDPDYATTEETPLFVDVPGVLSNDTDPENNNLEAFLNSRPGNGALTLNADGSFIYTPTLNFAGTDTFTYYVLDDGDPALSSEPATVTITVGNENDPPVVDDETWSVAENAAFDTVVGTLNVSDVDGETDFTFEIIDGNTDNAFSVNSAGELRVANSSALDFEAIQTFTLIIKVWDAGELSDEATVVVNLDNVNEPPVAEPDNYSTGEDTTWDVDEVSVLDNDYDPEHDLLTAVLVSTVSNGDLSFNEDGTFIYTPTLNFNGIVTFTYQAQDNGITPPTNLLSKETTVTITVEPQNDPPLADDDNYETPEDTPLIVDAENGILNGDSDIENDPLTAVLETPVSMGLLDLYPDGSFEYEPPLNFTGIVTFTYRAVERMHEEERGLASNIATVTINVTPVNDGPIIKDQTFEIDENSTDDFGPVIAADAEEDSLEYGILPGGSGDGVFGIDVNTGYITVLDSTALDIETTLGLGFTLTVVVSDTEPLTATATITINLLNVNEYEPTIEGDQSFTISENAADGSSVGTVAADDADWQETVVAFAIIGGNGDGIFSIDNSGLLQVFDNTNLDFETTNVYTLTIQATDNGTNPGTKNGTNDVYIYIEDANEPPVIDAESLSVTPTEITEGQTITLTGSFTDPDIAGAHTLFIDWGDGNSTQPAIQLAAGIKDFEVTHTYVDDPAGAQPDIYTIQVTVSDVTDPEMIRGAVSDN
ncbi:MAG: tandem-95 repeat protein, partial [Anaerolineae bacterium]|nr:tandem-95 repeat protein [Anaerolineae bacterium]